MTVSPTAGCQHAIELRGRGVASGDNEHRGAVRPDRVEVHRLRRRRDDVILLHPPLPLVGVSKGENRGVIKVTVSPKANYAELMYPKRTKSSAYATAAAGDSSVILPHMRAFAIEGIVQGHGAPSIFKQLLKGRGGRSRTTVSPAA